MIDYLRRIPKKKLNELKDLWIKELYMEKDDVAEWIFDTYLPKLYLYDNGSILFCSQKPPPLFREGYVVVMDLKSLQDKITEKAYPISSPRMDDYAMGKIIEQIRNL